MELVDESRLIEARSYALDVAWMSKAGVEARSVQIRFEPGLSKETTPIENLLTALERGLPNVERLLADGPKRMAQAFVPPSVFTLEQ